MHRRFKIAILLLALPSIFAKTLNGEWPAKLPIDAETLQARLDAYYSPLEDWRRWIEIDPENERARFDKQAPWIDLEKTRPPQFSQLGASSLPHIALDPGHIGGTWGPLEGRSFHVGEGPVFQEGDAVLEVAKRIQNLLEDYKVRISLVRSTPDPINDERPPDYIDQATRWAETQFSELAADDPQLQSHIRARANLLFYRSYEIRARATLVNKELRPDLVVCLHINAAGWEDPTHPTLSEENNLHILVHGNYTPGELKSVEARQALAHKIARHTFELERDASEIFLKVFKRTTELPPYIYRGDNALQLDEEGYLWARNLAANRLYQPPVVFLEPYVANSKEGYARITAGNYSGRKQIAGKERLSMIEEYARSTASALIELFKLERK